MKLDELLEWVDCRKECSCHGHEAARRFRLAVEMVRDAIGAFDSLAFGVNTMENLKKKLTIERDLLRERLEKIKEPPKQGGHVND